MNWSRFFRCRQQKESFEIISINIPSDKDDGCVNSQNCLYLNYQCCLQTGTYENPIWTCNDKITISNHQELVFGIFLAKEIMKEFKTAVEKNCNAKFKGNIEITGEYHKLGNLKIYTQNPEEVVLILEEILKLENDSATLDVLKIARP